MNNENFEKNECPCCGRDSLNYSEAYHGWICQHQNTCGYYAKDDYPDPPQYKAFAEDGVISSEFIRQYEYADPSASPLRNYLLEEHPEAEVDAALQMYHVGHDEWCDNSGAFYPVHDDIFWCIDEEGKVRNGRCFYKKWDEVKSGYTEYYSFMIQRLKRDALLPLLWKPQQCLFGQHLMADKSKPCVLVETEQRAIELSLYFPQYHWLSFRNYRYLNYHIDFFMENEFIVCPLVQNAVKFSNFIEKYNLQSNLQILYFISYCRSRKDLYLDAKNNKSLIS